MGVKRDTHLVLEVPQLMDMNVLCKLQNIPKSEIVTIQLLFLCHFPKVM